MALLSSSYCSFPTVAEATMDTFTAASLRKWWLIFLPVLSKLWTVAKLRNLNIFAAISLSCEGLKCFKRSRSSLEKLRKWKLMWPHLIINWRCDFHLKEQIFVSERKEAKGSVHRHLSNLSVPLNNFTDTFQTQKNLFFSFLHSSQECSNKYCTVSQNSFIFHLLWPLMVWVLKPGACFKAPATLAHQKTSPSEGSFLESS